MALDLRAVALRWFEEVWNQRNEAVIDELMSPDGVCYLDDGPLHGPDEFRTRQYEPFTKAFSSLNVTVEGTVCEGDEVVVRWSATGVHTGEGLGFKATNTPVTFRGTTWIRVKDGKLHEGWQTSNIPEVLRQLGES